MIASALAASHWLLTNVGVPVLVKGMNQLIVQMGMKNTPDASALVEKYIQQLEQEIKRVESKIDEDRLAKLLAALRQVNEAHKTVAEREYLTSALSTFHVVTNYPEQGTTGAYTNAQLRCVAFLGMAAAHSALKDPQKLVAEKMVEGIYSDVPTAKQWLGTNLVDQITSRFPPPGITCPKCGLQNPAGSQFCNLDGYPLNSSRKPSLQSSSQSQTSTLVISLISKLPDFMGSLANPLHINLDGKKIGTIRPGKSCTFEVQTGHHIIFLKMSGIISISSPPLSFDSASGERVTLLGQVKKGAWMNSILLWKQ